jgi:hypothetical protein
MKKFIWRILRFLHLAGIIQLWLKSGLTEDGWFKSFHAQQSLDAQGNPVPWFNYTFIKFLETRLKPTMTIFEYGSGNSTLWLAGKVQSIKAVEHDQLWVEKLKYRLPKNAQVVFQSLENKEKYVQEVAQEGILYDLVIVDGRERNNCMKACLPCLSAQGVIVLDNAERESYLPARQLLAENGFKCLEFWGMPAGSAHNACTALYYREGNIFEI